MEHFHTSVILFQNVSWYITAAKGSNKTKGPNKLSMPLYIYTVQQLHLHYLLGVRLIFKCDLDNSLWNKTVCHINHIWVLGIVEFTFKTMTYNHCPDGVAGVKQHHTENRPALYTLEYILMGFLLSLPFTLALWFSTKVCLFVV